MRYRNISLNGKDVNYHLVKYEDKFKRQLEDLKKIDERLALSVVNCSKSFSELSEYQCYMILDDFQSLVGCLQLAPSTDDRNLEVTLKYDENKFNERKSFNEFFKILLDSLGLFGAKYENLEVRFLNDVDLSRYLCQRKVYDEKLTTYIFSNRLNKYLMRNLLTASESSFQNLNKL